MYFYLLLGSVLDFSFHGLGELLAHTSIPRALWMTDVSIELMEYSDVLRLHRSAVGGRSTVSTCLNKRMKCHLELSVYRV